MGQFFTGSSFLHEALLFHTKKDKYYICQTYQIEFKQCDSYESAIKRIKSYWKLNNKSKNVDTFDVNLNGKKISVGKIIKVIEDLPDEYDLFKNNCQHFCKNVLEGIGLNY